MFLSRDALLIHSQADSKQALDVDSECQSAISLIIE
ncbi:hypothetical protein PCC9214_03326 [Planktothrix tepida]|nr:hypothetical protein PCC9214_03326 [Planktothrix tepida]